jgi:hypothetical protein
MFPPLHGQLFLFIITRLVSFLSDSGFGFPFLFFSLKPASPMYKLNFGVYIKGCPFALL